MTHRNLLTPLLAMLLALLPLWSGAVQPLDFSDTAEEQRFQHLTRWIAGTRVVKTLVMTGLVMDEGRRLINWHRKGAR